MSQTTTQQRGMRNGDSIFFKMGQSSTKKGAMKVAFKGFGIGVLLGQVPPFGKEPTPEQMVALMGTIGFLSFDDVAEFLGDEAAEKCVAMHERKYYGAAGPGMVVEPKEATPTEVAAAEANTDEPARSGLVTAQGKPIEETPIGQPKAIVDRKGNPLRVVENDQEQAP